jgi:hypothetical protein
MLRDKKTKYYFNKQQFGEEGTMISPPQLILVNYFFIVNFFSFQFSAYNS